MSDNALLYTGEDVKENWFYNRYYYGGSNSRYYTFQLALNILNQRIPNPIMIETGCQRQEEDVGAGMSTSIFAEYISKYGGELTTVDIEIVHLQRARSYIAKWPLATVHLICCDSVKYLQSYQGKCDFLYLDSLDYPIGQDANNIAMQQAAQEHCLKEFLAMEHRMNDFSLLLLDDNQMSGGGKPKLVKELLRTKPEWTLLLDLQSSLWLKDKRA